MERLKKGSSGEKNKSTGGRHAPLKWYDGTPDISVHINLEDEGLEFHVYTVPKTTCSIYIFLYVDPPYEWRFYDGNLSNHHYFYVPYAPGRRYYYDVHVSDIAGNRSEEDGTYYP